MQRFAAMQMIYRRGYGPDDQTEERDAGEQILCAQGCAVGLNDKLALVAASAIFFPARVHLDRPRAALTL